MKELLIANIGSLIIIKTFRHIVNIRNKKPAIIINLNKKRKIILCFYYKKRSLLVCQILIVFPRIMICVLNSLVGSHNLPNR